MPRFPTSLNLTQMQQLRNALVVLGFVFAVLIAYSKSQALTYGAIRFDFDTTSAFVTQIDVNHRHDDIIFVHYQFSSEKTESYEGSYEVHSLKEDYPYQVGSQLPVVYAKHFPEFNTLEEMHPQMRSAFYLFITCFILMPIDVMVALWYSVKIQQLRDNEMNLPF
ncbi:hypothetical protein [Vibrio porteresiae]|uniref:DUF3592 domain-containing protein n=1 Tax=Vibrio porteresiae DSM 19223 TaxID=1123496 RepID=A0ABZ0QAL7_9VIBR|nr:hypothetical protein [Vibrio porteresiae]WPC72817.1 hypothetical protein R8Z52_11850 [Vibrio porteresiae DSM 19223]